MLKLRIFYLILLLQSLLMSCNANTQKQTQLIDNKDTTMQAVEFPEELEWLNTDKPLTLKELRGKIIILDFWTYCCINCIHILPELKKLEQQYPQLVVVGVHSAKFNNEQDKQNIREAIVRYEIEHPVIVDNDFLIWKTYGIRSWPSFVVIDDKGKYVGQTSGEGIYDSFNKLIQELTQKGGNEIDTVRKAFVLERNLRPFSFLSYPGKIEADKVKKRLFFTDSNHNRIIITNPNGEILEIIGSGVIGNKDGGFEECSFFRPQGLAYDSKTDVLYVADTENHLIRKIDLTKKIVSTIAGTGEQSRTRANKGNGTTFPLNSPWDICLENNQLYIAMAGPHQLWTLNLQNNDLQVFAGSGHEDIVDGPRLNAALAQPSGIVMNKGILYFADSEVSAIRKVEQDNVKTLIGEGLFEFGDIDGKYPAARLQHCLGVDYQDDKLLIADTYNHKMKRYDPATHNLSSWIGNGKRGYRDGKASQAQFNEPNDITFLDGNYYIMDTNNDLIRIYNPANDEVSTFIFKNQWKLSMMDKQKRNQSIFTGEKIQLSPQEVSTSNISLELVLEIPNEFVINADAPNYADFLNKSLFISNSKPNQITIKDNIQLTDNQKEIIIETDIYYCNKKQSSKCAIKQYQFTIPVSIQTGKTQNIQLKQSLSVE